MVTAIVLIVVCIGTIVSAALSFPGQLSLRVQGEKVKTQMHFLKLYMLFGAFSVKGNTFSSKILPNLQIQNKFFKSQRNNSDQPRTMLNIYAHYVL